MTDDSSDVMTLQARVRAPRAAVKNALTEAAALRTWLAEYAEVALPQRFAFCVEDARDVALRELAHRLRVEPVLHAARQGAGEDDELRVLRQVTKLLEERLEV